MDKLKNYKNKNIPIKESRKLLDKFNKWKRDRRIPTEKEKIFDTNYWTFYSKCIKQEEPCSYDFVRTLYSNMLYVASTSEKIRDESISLSGNECVLKYSGNEYPTNMPLNNKIYEDTSAYEFYYQKIGTFNTYTKRNICDRVLKFLKKSGYDNFLDIAKFGYDVRVDVLSESPTGDKIYGNIHLEKKK